MTDAFDTRAREIQMSGIYIASRTHHAKRWRQLRDSGAPIISTWIDMIADDDTDAAEDDLDALWAKSLTEISSAEMLVLYAEPDDFPFRGAFIETGMAMMAGISIRIVAPNVRMDRHGRPFGSWTKHRNVEMFLDIASAIRGESK